MLGGAFAGPNEKLSLGTPASRIYICSNIFEQSSRFRVLTAIRELAHYVSGAGFQILDPLNGDFFTPARRDPGVRSPSTH